MDYPQSLTNADILGQGNLDLVREKSGKCQGILLSIICGNPDIQLYGTEHMFTTLGLLHIILQISTRVMALYLCRNFVSAQYLEKCYSNDTPWDRRKNLVFTMCLCVKSKDLAMMENC